MMNRCVRLSVLKPCNVYSRSQKEIDLASYIEQSRSHNPSRISAHTIKT